MNNKYFIITIDTEADNQWDNNHECTTENSRYLPRFQELAEKYGFKPVWLTTYEMANDDYFVKYFKTKQDNNLCEIGMHLHAWNNPPYYKLKKETSERSYLIEYPYDVMDKKIQGLDKLLTKKFGLKPVSHRSGRWAMNDNYFKLLLKNGYKVDCSVTPHIDWSKNLGESGIPGSDYSDFPEAVYYNGELLEVPVTVKNIHFIQLDRIKSFKNVFGEMKRFILGRNQWMRPDKYLSISGIKKVIKECFKKNEYVMFMIHSSELMPGGSPSFKTEESIEKLYKIIEDIFKYSTALGYKGITLRDYYNMLEGEKK